MHHPQYSKAHKTKGLVLCAFSIIQWIPFAKNGKSIRQTIYARSLLLL